MTYKIRKHAKGLKTFDIKDDVMKVLQMIGQYF